MMNKNSECDYFQLMQFGLDERSAGTPIRFKAPVVIRSTCPMQRYLTHIAQIPTNIAQHRFTTIVGFKDKAFHLIQESRFALLNDKTSWPVEYSRGIFELRASFSICPLLSIHERLWKNRAVAGGRLRSCLTERKFGWRSRLFPMLYHVPNDLQSQSENRTQRPASSGSEGRKPPTAL